MLAGVFRALHAAEHIEDVGRHPLRLEVFDLVLAQVKGDQILGVIRVACRFAPTDPDHVSEWVDEDLPLNDFKA